VFCGIWTLILRLKYCAGKNRNHFTVLHEAVNFILASCVSYFHTCAYSCVFRNLWRQERRPVLLMTYQADSGWPKLRHRPNDGYVNNCLVINLFVVILIKCLTVSFRLLERPPMPSATSGGRSAELIKCVCTKAKRAEGRSIPQFHTIGETFKSEQKRTFKVRYLTAWKWKYGLPVRVIYMVRFLWYVKVRREWRGPKFQKINSRRSCFYLAL